MTRIYMFSAIFLNVITGVGMASDLCTGKTPGTISFYSQQIERDKPLPTPAKELTYKTDMYALACLTDAVGPQPSGGKSFRLVLWVDGKQFNVTRPELSKPRKEIIISIKEDFGDRMSYMIDPGKHKLRIQAAAEKASGKVDVSFDFKNDVAYIQQLRNAGYLADGQIEMVK